MWDHKNYRPAPHDISYYMQDAVDTHHQKGWGRLGKLLTRHDHTFAYLWFKAKDPVSKRRLLVSYWSHPLKNLYGSCTRIILFFMKCMHLAGIAHYDMPRPDVAADVLRSMSRQITADSGVLRWQLGDSSRVREKKLRKVFSSTIQAL